METTPAVIFYVDSPGGTGKTFLYNTLIETLRTKYRQHCITVAWTGTAANLLIRGQTMHGAFKLRIDVPDDTVPGWPIEHHRSQFIKEAALII